MASWPLTPKVADLDPTPLIDQQVAGLDVAMDDSRRGVQVPEPGDDLPREPRQLCLRDGADGSGHVGEGSAVHVVQHDADGPLGEERRVVGHDVRAVAAVQRPQLGDDVLANLRLHVHLDDLPREDPTGGSMGDALHDAAAAASDDVDDLQVLERHVERRAAVPAAAFGGGGAVRGPRPGVRRAVAVALAPDSSSAPSSSSLDEVDRARSPSSRDFPPRFSPSSSAGESSRTARLAPVGVATPARLAPVGVGAGAVGVPTPEMRRPRLSISSSPSRNAPESVRSYGLASSFAVGSEMVTFLRLSGIAANPAGSSPPPFSTRGVALPVGISIWRLRRENAWRRLRWITPPGRGGSRSRG